MDNIENEWLTVADVCASLDIPAETVRRYIRNHSIHLKAKKSHKKYLIHHDSLEVLRQIRELYAAGKSVDEIKDILTQKGVPATFTVETTNENDERVTVSVTDELQAIKTELEEQKRFNQLLLEQLHRQQKYIEQEMKRIDERLEERDRRLMESIRTLQKQKRERIEEAKKEENVKKRRGIFRFLFRG
jgi:DNA-binding transcriptional MerR regulator